MLAGSSGLYSLRVAKFVASRIKKWDLLRRRRGLVRINVGRLYVLYKKGLNLRMGRGVGAYFTKRRLVLPGFK